MIADATAPTERTALSVAIEETEGRLRQLRAIHAERRADLPLRFWRQQAHFTTPASDERTARKAIEQGTSPMIRILERFGVSVSMLCDRLELPEARVEALLHDGARAPLVMLDGEDAQALRDDVASEGIRTAARVLADAAMSRDHASTLRFFRPPGLALDSCVRDLYRLMWALAETKGPDTFPLDGIVFPKIEHPEDVDAVFDMLERAEVDLGLPVGTVKVAFLVESGWAAAQLPEIARRAIPRLTSLIFGVADFAADLGLPRIDMHHPLADWARAIVVDVAGACGVPAIDAMTLDYPVADQSLDVAGNRQRFLDRMALVYHDARRSHGIGMSGKWVGHPAQLFAVLLAFDPGLDETVLETEVAKLEAYRASVDEEGRGAMIIDGVMSDRATDRHARVRLRRAVALGRFDVQRALALDVIRPDELDGIDPQPSRS